MVLPFSLSFDFCVSCCWRCFGWQNFETIATFWSGIVIQYKITDTSIYQIILSTRFPSVPVYYLRYKGIFLRKQITVAQLVFFLPELGALGRKSLWRAVSKKWRFRIRLFPVRERPIRVKIYAVLKISGFLWTWPKFDWRRTLSSIWRVHVCYPC